MTMNWAGTAGLVSSLAGSILNYSSQKSAIEAQNRANKAAWERAAQDTRDQLTIAYNRTLTGLQEVNRDKIRNKIAVRSAGAKAVGTASVQAAQLGIVGRRGSTAPQEIEREVAQKVSDAQINSEIQSRNLTQAYTDTATAAVDNLNNQAPTLYEGPGTLEMLTGTLSTGVNYYNQLSSAQKSDVKSNFKWAATKLTEPLSWGSGV